MVAKVPHPTTPDHWIRGEALYTEAVRAAGAPAPQVIDVVKHDGRLVGLYEQVVGASMWDLIRRSPGEAAHFGRMLASLHRQITELRAPLVLPRQSDRLASKLRRSAAATAPDVIAALELLPDGWSATDLCHGDLHPGNVVIAHDGPVVIDWFDACRGWAVADVARSSLLMGAGGATIGSILHLAGAMPSVLFELHRAYMDEMTALLGISESDVLDWWRVEAAARLSEGVAVDELLAVWRGESVPSVAP